jgi:hypothetical protein
VSNEHTGRRGAGIIVALLSLLLGGGAAAAAVSSVVSANAPNDTKAVQTGPSAPVAPNKVIHYGG